MDINELFNYKTSFLNPALKILVPLILLYGVYYFYRARKEYGGEVAKLVRRLLIAGVVGVLAMTFRYLADAMGTTFKWGESIGLLIWVLFNLWAVWPLLTFVTKMEREQEEAHE